MIPPKSPMAKNADLTGSTDTDTQNIELTENVLLRTRGIIKDFPGLRALDDIDFDLAAGEVHVLFGENGAGKSTLINVIAGALKPDSGALKLNGQDVHLHSVHDARRLGIAAVFQEFSLAPDLTVEDNMYLGAEPTKGFVLDRRAIRSGARQTLDRLGFEIDSRAAVSSLSRAEQQMVEIAKALLTEPEVLILDEPTSSLTEKEIGALFALISALKASGVGIIYITHRIAEIHEVGDRVTVLRDGKKIDTLFVADATQKKLVELMTGRKVGEFFQTIDHQPAETVLATQNLCTADGRVHNVSIEVHAGEIVGLAGLVGCGKSEIGRACFGAIPISNGTMEFLGQRIARPTPRKMLKSGLCYIPSDRRYEGLMLGRSARENMALSVLGLEKFSRFGVLRRANERALTKELGKRMHVTPPQLESEVGKYSGGNQQKILLSKSIARDTKVFIFDEPTVGIDVGAKTEIYQFLKDLLRNDVGILLISSDLPEILNLCNRAYVIHGGSVRSHLQGPDITEHNVLASFFEDSREPSHIGGEA